jgi:hypothetical protein
MINILQGHLIIQHTYNTRAGDIWFPRPAGPGVVTLTSFVNGALRELIVGLCRDNVLSYGASVGMLARSCGASFRADLSAGVALCVVCL